MDRYYFKQDEADKLKKVIERAVQDAIISNDLTVHVGWPRVGDVLTYRVTVSVDKSSPRPTPISLRYLENCAKNPELKPEWLYGKVKLDGTTYVIEGWHAKHVRPIMLKSTVANNWGSLTVDQLVMVIEKNGIELVT